MTCLSKNGPKQFWKLINSYGKGQNTGLSGETLIQFAEHFKNLSNSIGTQQTFDSSILGGYNVEVKELDRPIILSEIRHTISTSK